MSPRHEITRADGSHELHEDASYALVRSPGMWLAVVGAMAVGAVSFWGGAGGAILGSGGGTSGGTVSTAIGAPATPTITVVPLDTAANLLSSAFSGDQGDTHASSDWWITRTNGDTVWSDFTSDSLESRAGAGAGTDSIKTDSTYLAYVRHNGTSGGASAASAPDTFVATEAVVDTALYPNLPAGMTTITQWDGTSLTLSGWTGNWNDNGAVVADTTNPLGTDSVLQATYGVGENSAGANTMNTFPDGPYAEVYIMYRIFYGPDWENIGHKNYYWGAEPGSRVNTESTPTQYYITRESTDNALISGQNGGSGDDLVIVDAWGSPNGEWRNVELHVVAQSAPGVADGAFYYYQDGVLLGSKEDVNWVPAGQAEARFSGLRWYRARNTSNTQESFFRVGELLIAGKN